MAKYRKKPVVIEAFLLGVDDEPEWFREAVRNGEIEVIAGIMPSSFCYIHTLEGMMKAVAGKDYIIRGVNGEFYPCKASIFEKTYEAVRMMSKRKLKSCKRCGAKEIRLESRHGYFVYVCNFCGRHASYCTSEGNAREAWDRSN